METCMSLMTSVRSVTISFTTGLCRSDSCVGKYPVAGGTNPTTPNQPLEGKFFQVDM